MKIILDWFREHNLQECPELITFAKCWPDGMEITLGNLYELANLGLNLTWFAYEVLDRAGLYAFEMKGNAREARHAENEAVAPAMCAFAPSLYGGEPLTLEQMPEAERVFDEACCQARRAYHRARVPDLWKALQK